MKKSCAHAAVLDMDGTLIDCEPLNRAAVEEAACGYEIDWSLMAGQSERIIHAWIRQQDPNFKVLVDDFVVECKRGYESRNNRICARTGMIEVLKMFQCRSVPIVVVTNTDHTPAVDKLYRAGVLDFLDTKTFKDGILGKDDLIAQGFQPKPQADPYVVAAEFLGARHLTIYEDSPAGMDSAIAAREILHARCGTNITVAHIFDYGAQPDSRADHLIDGRQPTDLILRTSMILDQVHARLTRSGGAPKCLCG